MSDKIKIALWGALHGALLALRFFSIIWVVYYTIKAIEKYTGLL